VVDVRTGLPRILVNATSARVGGGLSYLRQQLGAFVEVWPSSKMDVLVSPWNAQYFEGQFPFRVRRVPLRNAGQRAVWEQAVLPVVARRYDVLYCPANVSPLLGTTPVVLTQQNLNHVGRARTLAHNRTVGGRVRGAISVWSMRRATTVVAISESLRDEMIADPALNAMVHRLQVVRSGAAEWPEPPSPPSVQLPDDPFVLTVANPSVHKRTSDVVSAWARAESAAPLVLVGRRSANEMDVYQRVAGARASDMHHLGPIGSPAELRYLYGHAAVTVSMSALEAFPLVPHEAGSVGCPLVLSDIPAHREVAMAHATYVPLGDLQGAADAIDRVVTTPPARSPWRWPVTWKDNAREMAEIFKAAYSDL
jgi:glycosyltransferase involved in cell wall biosynthesis